MANVSSLDMYNAMMEEIRYNKELQEIKKNIPKEGQHVELTYTQPRQGRKGDVKKRVRCTVIKHYDTFFLALVQKGNASFKECFDYIEFCSSYHNDGPRIICEYISSKESGGGI